MSPFRRLAIVALAAAAAPLVAVAADKASDHVITGEITPGVYGRVDVSKRPVPARVYDHPMLIDAPAPGESTEPVYLHVPPKHAQNWKKHCREYDACNKPVYFVKSAEYEPGYSPAKAQVAEGERPKRKYRSGW